MVVLVFFAKITTLNDCLMINVKLITEILNY
jgi:hypothetical protein